MPSDAAYHFAPRSMRRQECRDLHPERLYSLFIAYRAAEYTAIARLIGAANALRAHMAALRTALRVYTESMERAVDDVVRGQKVPAA
jgi:hypothetical protein